MLKKIRQQIFNYCIDSLNIFNCFINALYFDVNVSLTKFKYPNVSNSIRTKINKVFK